MLVQQLLLTGSPVSLCWRWWWFGVMGTWSNQEEAGGGTGGGFGKSGTSPLGVAGSNGLKTVDNGGGGGGNGNPKVVMVEWNSNNKI